jgi:hypothetical protein
MSNPAEVYPDRTERWTASVRGMTRMIWGWLPVLAGLVSCLAILPPAYFTLDAICQGPYTVDDNRKCQRLANQSQLVGRSEDEVIKILGEPTDVWEYNLGGQDFRTYAYSPCFWINRSVYQVQCSGGSVKGVAASTTTAEEIFNLPF